MPAPPLPKSRTPRPETLGRYEMIARIARGGMGTVFLARHAGEAGFARLFAVKVMHPHLAEDQAFVEMLRDEARIAARLHHPNVVPILDLGSQGETHYVVMEYVEGCSLAALLKHQTERRPAAVIATVMIETLDGLHAAHVLVDDDGVPLNLVHRDVSPQNVLVGVDGVARITDFGIAKAESRITSTQPGTHKGKLAYMAPEQMLSDVVDSRADVFAAGAVLWTALTGTPLFHGATEADTLKNLLHLEIPAPSTVGLHPPQCLDWVVAKALARDPAQRYQTAQEFADALREVCVENGLLASKRDVAEWVNSAFGEEFAQRRAAIRAATKRREGDAASTLDEVSVPSIPSLTGPQSGEISSSSVNVTQPGPAAVSGERESQGAVATPPAFATPSTVTLTGVEGSGKRRGAGRWIAVAAALCALVVVAIWFAGDRAPRTAAPPTVAAVGERAVQPAVARTTEAPPPAATAPVAPAAVASAPLAAEPDKAAAAAATGARRAAAAGAPARPAPASAPPTAVPVPATDQQKGIERNPYLKR